MSELKPIDPQTGTTETAAEKKARLAKQDKVALSKSQKQNLQNIYFNWEEIDGKVYWFKNWRDGKYGRQMVTDPKGTLTGIDKIAYEKAVKEKEKQGTNTPSQKEKLRKEKEVTKSVKVDYLEKKNTYVNLVQMYGSDGGGVVTPQQMEKARKDAEQARRAYIKAFKVDPADPKTDLNAPEKITGGEGLDDKAKAQSTKNTQTITTGGDTSLLSGIGLIVDPDTAETGYTWKKNTSAIPVALVGDTNGKYVGAGLTGASDDALTAGSPVGFQAYLDRIIQRYSARSGGIAELKEMLYNKNAYGSDKAAGISLRYGDEIDPNFSRALYKALLSTSNANYRRLMQNKNKKNITFIDFESYLKTGGKLPMEVGIGEGANGKVIQRQVFKPEEYEIAIDQLFQATVGRGATDEELNDFLGKLRSYESSNPQTTIVSGSETGAETTTTSGGVDEGVAGYLAREQALTAPDAQKNAYDKYFNYVMQAMDTGIELG